MVQLSCSLSQGFVLAWTRLVTFWMCLAHVPDEFEHYLAFELYCRLVKLKVHNRILDQTDLPVLLLMAIVSCLFEIHAFALNITFRAV